MIRLATIEDMPELLRMSQAFFDVSGYSGLTTFDKDDSEELLKTLVDGNTLLTDGNGAMLGFVVFPMFMNRGTLIAQELFWWVDEDKRKSGVGLKLLRAAEKHAKELGAKAMMMLSIADLDGDKVNKLYKAKGYKPQEQSFMRVL